MAKNKYRKLVNVYQVEDFELPSFELFYEPIYNKDYDMPLYYRSQLRINDPKLGVLLPSYYMPVAQKANRVVALNRFALDGVFNDILFLKQREIYVDWISIAISPTFLSSSNFFDVLEESVENATISYKDFCIELPIEILYENENRYKGIFDKLKELGVKTMITDFGGQFCPIGRFEEFMTDYVLLDRRLTEPLCDEKGNKSQIANTVLDYVISHESTPIIVGIEDNEMCDKLPSKCKCMTGKIAGKTVSIREIENNG